LAHEAFEPFDAVSELTALMRVSVAVDPIAWACGILWPLVLHLEMTSQ
jgi:hypothetical protein